MEISFTEPSKKLARTCGMFFKVGNFLPINVLICLYNFLFSPFLRYGMLVWGLTHETHINLVLQLEKRVIRAIAFETFTSFSTPIFSSGVVQRSSGHKGLDRVFVFWALGTALTPQGT